MNVFVVIYEKRAARRYSSVFLYADAVHTQSDVGVTTVVLVGLPLVLRGYLYLDAILALGISLFIAYSGFQVLQRTVPTLIDAAAVDAEVIRKMAIGLPRVVAARDIRSLLHGGRKFVELDAHRGRERPSRGARCDRAVGRAHHGALRARGDHDSLRAGI